VPREKQRAYDGFGGRVGRTLADSEPWWEPVRTPPEGAPNVIVILCDDLGFSDIGCYGSEIDTPNLDALAAAGLRFADFHATPLCSPSRATLLTGMNHHAAGVGNLAGADRGFPGYRGEIAEDVVTAAEVFRHNGYRTLMVGKWHLSRTEDHSDAGRRDAWPLGRGFDRFYGFMESGLTNLHQPNMLHEDNHAVTIDAYPEDYYFTDDITDRAIEMIRGIKASDASTPFFLYCAHGAVHAPLMAKQSDIARYRGRYDVGWDVLREERFARQKALGVVPQHTQLPPRNAEPGYDVTPWEDLSEKEQRLFARHMEVYAGMVDNVDQNWGRLRDALAQLGELENTVVIFTSDNGASREGGAKGTTEYFKTVAAVHSHAGHFDQVDHDFERIELLGGPRVMSHYPWGWGMASNTPFRLHKGTTFQGGHHVPFILSWPRGIRSAGEVRNQYAHLTDVLPALVEMIGLEVPLQRAGRPVRPMTGVSFASVLDAPGAPSPHTEQYYEMSGHRAYRSEGWESVTLHYPRTPFEADRWQLYDLLGDPAQVRDLAAEHPERVDALAKSWEAAAWENQVFPLDDGSGMNALARPGAPLPPAPVTLYPGTPTLERSRAAALIQGRSFSVRVRLEHLASAAGMLFAHGDQGGGYALYIEDDGRCTYAHNAYGSMTVVPCATLEPGEHEVVLDVSAAGGTWDVTVLVDGTPVGSARGLETPSFLAPFEGIDVGLDRRSPVSWDVYERHGPFPYQGRLHSVTYEPGAPAASARPSAEEERAAMQRYQ